MNESLAAPGSAGGEGAESAGAGSTHVVDARFCIRCGYALSGLPIAGRCPECGTAVALSLREPTLAGASPEYRESLRSGLTLVLNALLLMVGLLIVGIGSVAFASIAFTGTWSERAIELGINGLNIVVSAMLLWGYWKYTEPDPSQVAKERQESARRVIRVTVVVQAALAVVGLPLLLVEWYALPVAPAGGGTGSAPAPGLSVWQMLGMVLVGATSVLSFVAWVVQFFAVMRYTRWVATRIPDERVIARTKRYMWLLPVISFVGMVVLFLGPLIALVMYWKLLDRVRRQVRSIIATGLPVAG